jgi:hypothetical protein
VQTPRIYVFENGNIRGLNPKAVRFALSHYHSDHTGAELWIEHDISTHETLPKSPAYVD